MGMPLPQLQGLLLDMLSTVRPVDPSSIAALSPDDWDVLMGMARQHRLLPLLHWRLTKERNGLPVPPMVSERLAAGFERWTHRALLMQRELLLIHRILDEAGIPHLALKGAYLAFHAYPHPALRPMRDLDILVPEAMAMQAYQVLLDAGFVRFNKYHRGDPDATMLTRRHLPPLLSASGRITVEVHTRLSDPDEGDSHPGFNDMSPLWQRAFRQSVAGDTLAYLSPTDLLLHLIEHAVYHHRLDNGPLVLSDLAFLLQRHAIDWPWFWQRTGDHGHTRGALLLLKMVERYFGKQPIDWYAEVRMDDGTVDAMIDEASLLTLRDISSKMDFNLEVNVLSHSTTRGKLGFFFKKVFPLKKEMATFYPVAENSLQIYLWYPIRWWHIVTMRLPEFLARKKTDHMGNEVRHIIRLEQWLDEPSPASLEDS